MGEVPSIADSAADPGINALPFAAGRAILDWWVQFLL